jgi:hypothetical protein
MRSRHIRIVSRAKVSVGSDELFRHVCWKWISESQFKVVWAQEAYEEMTVRLLKACQTLLRIVCG